MRQLAHAKTPTAPQPVPARVSDDEIRESIENNQLKLQRERGADLTLFSPRASAMGHHEGDEQVSIAWTRACNDLVQRVVALYPDNFASVCQLPQSPGAPLAHVIEELQRCVLELGFVGCNLNPDPSGGHWTSPPLTDRHWYPLYEKMVELDVPAMVHVSASCNPISTPPERTTSTPTPRPSCSSSRATCSATSPRCDSSYRMAVARCRITGVAIGAGRHAQAAAAGRACHAQRVLRHLRLSPAGIDLLVDVIDVDNILFGSEMVGAVRGIDPTTGHYFDDTKRYIDALDISAADKHKIFEGNARRVYPRLDAQLKARGR